MACFTIANGKLVWNYAKKVIDDELAKGRVIEFPELAKQIADGIRKVNPQSKLVEEDIARLISMPKSVRVAREDLIVRDKVRQTTRRAAKDFVEGTEETPASSLLKLGYQLPYATKVAGHTFALMMTHGWTAALDPLAWKHFGPSWVNSVKSMSESNARALAQSIQSSKLYPKQLRSKLAVDPGKVTDDMQRRAEYWGSGAVGQWFNKTLVGRGIAKLGEMASNSFLGLKELRQKMWEDLYTKAPADLKTEANTRELENVISERVNHMTGASPEVPMMGAVGKTARAIAFAPSLDIARVMRIVDFAKDTGITFRDAMNRMPVYGEQLKKTWGDASPAEKFVARQNMKQWARIAGTFSAILYANHLVLNQFFGSKEDINVKDPFKADWLATKGPNGRIGQITGGQIPLIRTGIKIVGKPEEAGSALGSYLMGKLNPALSLAKTLYTGKTFGGDVPEPLGKGKGTVGNWLAFATSELGPIATEDGIKEFSKQMSDQNGAPQEHNANFLRAIYKAGLVTIPAALGTHTYQPKPPKTTTHFPKVPQ